MNTMNWRKSSYSAENGGECVEVASWRKSSYSGGNGTECVADLELDVALDRQRQFIRRHAGAVVDDRDQPLAAFLDGDVDARGPGIDRVLDQLLDRRCRALDDLARGDAVDENRRQ